MKPTINVPVGCWWLLLVGSASSKRHILMAKKKLTGDWVYFQCNIFKNQRRRLLIYTYAEFAIRSSRQLTMSKWSEIADMQRTFSTSEALDVLFCWCTSYVLLSLKKTQVKIVKFSNMMLQTLSWTGWIAPQELDCFISCPWWNSLQMSTYRTYVQTFKGQSVLKWNTKCSCENRTYIFINSLDLDY